MIEILITYRGRTDVEIPKRWEHASGSKHVSS